MKSIGKYQVIEELGESATGRTYRARDAFRKREFAVKILETVPGLGAETKEQFCAHLASCAELTHRHIAKIDDLGEVDEGIFVATAWRPGVHLAQFMQQSQELPLDQKLATIAQVAEGLAFAHSRGIVHGNLKPSNIFVDAARDVCILDFGTARWLAALIDAGSRPETLVANYLAPEQVLGKPFDERSDVFSLGLMLYEFASGRYPYSADPGVIPREIVHSEPESLRKLDPKIPQELEQLVARALKKDPEQRLQSAEEFASGLYLAAQQLRRAALSSLPPEPPAQPQAAVDPRPSQPVSPPAPPALAPEPAIPKPARVALETPALPLEAADAAPLDVPALQMPASAQKVRERPQDAEPPARPWSARSYAAGSSRPPSAGVNAPKAPAAPAPPAPVSAAPAPAAPVSAAPAAPPPPPPLFEFQPPQSFLKPEALFPPEPPPRKNTKLSKRMLTAVVGLVLAAAIVGSMISRQNLRASQNKNHAASPSRLPRPSSNPNPLLRPPNPKRVRRSPAIPGRTTSATPNFPRAKR